MCFQRFLIRSKESAKKGTIQETESDLQIEYCFLHEDFFLLLGAGLYVKNLSCLDSIDNFKRMEKESDSCYLNRLFSQKCIEGFTPVDYSDFDDFYKMIFIQWFIQTKGCDRLKHEYFERLWKYVHENRFCDEPISINTKDPNRTDTNPLLGVFQKSIGIRGK